MGGRSYSQKAFWRRELGAWALKDGRLEVGALLDKGTARGKA